MPSTSDAEAQVCRSRRALLGMAVGEACTAAMADPLLTAPQLAIGPIAAATAAGDMGRLSAALDHGVASQLQAHIRISLNVGLTIAQLKQLAAKLADAGQTDAGQRLQAALDSHPGG